jgi:phosphoenolpyruvate synthase/pyruvate phosphate dikinase
MQRITELVLTLMFNPHTGASSGQGHGRREIDREDAQGFGVSPGVYEGPARVIRTIQELPDVQQGEILVTPSTGPTFNVILPLIGALVTERGGALSHAAIVAREYGLPGIVGCPGATAAIRTGMRIRVDGAAGKYGSRREGCPARRGRAESIFGGKAVSLGAALRAGLPVPPGIAIPSPLVDAIASGVSVTMSGVLDVTGLPDGRMAVRSSAVGEDSGDASFAGQHATKLNVRIAQLEDAVRTVWQSARSPAALAYRARKGLSPDPRMGVVVQALIEPLAAGVLFTRNPITGAHERLIRGGMGPRRGDRQRDGHAGSLSARSEWPPD